MNNFGRQEHGFKAFESALFDYINKCQFIRLINNYKNITLNLLIILKYLFKILLINIGKYVIITTNKEF